MPIDKKAFLASIAGNKPADAGNETEPDGDEPMSCGEQLVKALGLSVDPGAVDDALREAVARYGSPEPAKEY
jgi:hypothetical protein